MNLLSLAFFFSFVKWVWSSVYSRANHSPLLRQDLHQIYTLPNTPWAVRFSRLGVETGIIPSPIRALDTINSNSFTSFFPRQHVVFSYTITDSNSVDSARGAPAHLGSSHSALLQRL